MMIVGCTEVSGDLLMNQKVDLFRNPSEVWIKKGPARGGGGHAGP